MRTQRIYSKNADYQKFEVLKTNRNKRYKYYEFFVEGVRNINEAINNGWTIQAFIYSYEKQLSRWATDILKNNPAEMHYELTDALMADLSSKTDTSELLAVLKMQEDSPQKIKLSENPVIALFDRPSNKGNLGTIIRSCDALGIEGLVITGHAVDLYDPDTIAATMGSFFKVPVCRMADNQSIQAWISSLKERYPALKVIGSTAHAECSIDQIDLTTPVLFLIGNETDGLSNMLCEISDVMGTIPMASDSSASSFNVACAASIMFYEAARQRNLK
ncbi:MAG: rRNA methyltransferase [Clostridia bacterium]|nr:rRNA methyltransferase [Clostridia bacterium]